MGRPGLLPVLLHSIRLDRDRKMARFASRRLSLAPRCWCPALHALLSSHTIHTFRCVRTAMTTLTIRNVDAAMKERLRVRAARNGRSMEAELRQILSDTLAPDSGREPNLAEAIRRRFA